jgi:hypothetical protein
MKQLISSFVFLATCALSLPSLAQTQCNWYGTNYPLCNNQTSGWGYENNKSCIGSVTCNSQSGGTTASSTPAKSSTPASKAASSTPSTGGGGQCNWYGTNYPICANTTSGWGYENNKSCISTATCNTQSGGGGGTTTSSSSAASGGGSGGGTAGVCPTNLSCPSGIKCGCYTVSGLGANKKSYTAAGADRRFLASAMMETEKMDTNYTLGDGKSGDAFNAGAAKQNWGMMRQCHAAWKNLTANDYSNSTAMNSNKSLDVQVYNECRSYWGDQKFFAGHRNGSSGLSNPNTQDINNFISGYTWGYNQLSGHESDDVRFWVDIPAI